MSLVFRRGVIATTTHGNVESTPFAEAWAAAVSAGGGAYSAGTLDALEELERDLNRCSLAGKLIYLNMRCGSNIAAAKTPLIARNGPGLDVATGIFSSWLEGRGLVGTGVMALGVDPAASGLNASAASAGVYLLADAPANINAMLSNDPFSGNFNLTVNYTDNYILFDSGASGRAQTDNSLLSDGEFTKGLIAGSRYGVNSAAVFRNGIIRGQTALTASGAPAVDLNTYASRGISGGEFIGLALTPDDIMLLTWIMHDFQKAIERRPSSEGVVAYTSTPDPFTFTDVTGVVEETQQISNAITVVGTSLPSVITVTGGRYRINGGAFTSSPGTVDPGDTVAAEHDSANDEFIYTNTIVTIGGVSDTFTSLTTGTPAPIAWSTTDNGFGVVTEGPQNLLATRENTSGFLRYAISDTSQSTGDRYFELNVEDFGSVMQIGICGTGIDLDNINIDPTGTVLYRHDFGFYVKDGVDTGVSNPGAFTAGDIIGGRVNFGAATVSFNKNNGAWSTPLDITSLGADIFFIVGLGALPYSRAYLEKNFNYTPPVGATDWND